MIKYSIVIPTYNHLDDCLKPCIESIIKFTDLSTTEVIVVANGCVDGTKDYLASLPQDQFKTVWIDKAAGYTHSTNRGIEAAKGEYVILLNNDTVLLAQNTNDWINMLVAPFLADEKVGATGPMLNWCPHSERNFLIFFCVMIKKTMFGKFGLLDEIYNPGFGEDTDFSILLQEGGYKCVQVPYQDPLVADMKQERMTGGFPIFHYGEKTLGTLPGGDELLNRNRKILETRWKNKKPSYQVTPQLHVMGQKEEKPGDPYAHLMKLNLGCGDTLLDGYLNADLYNPAAQVKADAFNLPFPDERFDEIFACHIFEHLNPYKIADVLTSWKRVLKPGGKLIMEMPDILELCKNFEKSNKDERYRLLNCIYGTTQIEHPHVFGWYPEILNDHLMYAGYENIVFMPAHVYHWGFNFRVECQKSTRDAIVRPEVGKIAEDHDIIKLSPVGWHAGDACTTHSENTGIGFNAMVEMTKDYQDTDKSFTEMVLNSKLPPIPNQELPPGYFTDQDIKIYRDLVSHVPDGGTIAELGCWKGRSLCSIADIIIKKNLNVIVVDTFEGTDNSLENVLVEQARTQNIRALFEDNITRYGIYDHVLITQATTNVASKFIEKNSLDFVFIDADHRYEAVKDDVYNWMPLLKRKGVIAGHDASWHTVSTAIGEIFEHSKIYCLAELWWAEKIEKTGLIYDCFTFFNELDILEIRLNELDSVVDKFVLVEATTTHTGLPKPLYFANNKARFAKFLDKIIHVVVNLPKEGDTWVRERAQRDLIAPILKERCLPGDIIMVSDADEIPRMETVRDYRHHHGPKQFLQQLYYYSLNNRCVNDSLWNWGKIMPYGDYVHNNMTPCAVRYTEFPPLEKGGWHFSFIGNVEFIKKKISSWAHAEFNTPEINNNSNIEGAIKNGKDVFGRHLKFEKVAIDATYPEFIQKNKVALVEKELIRE